MQVRLPCESDKQKHDRIDVRPPAQFRTSPADIEMHDSSPVGENELQQQPSCARGGRRGSRMLPSVRRRWCGGADSLLDGMREMLPSVRRWRERDGSPDGKPSTFNLLPSTFNFFHEGWSLRMILIPTHETLPNFSCLTHTPGERTVLMGMAKRKNLPVLEKNLQPSTFNLQASTVNCQLLLGWSLRMILKSQHMRPDPTFRV